MSESSIRRTGVAAILAGILWIFKEYVREPVGLPVSVAPPLEVVFFLLVIVALLGMRSAQAGRDGALGRAGVVVAVAGAGVLAIEHSILTVFESILGRGYASGPEWIDTLDLIGFPLGFLLGNVLFGISAIRANVLPRWATVLYTIGLPIGLVLRLSLGSLLGFLLFGAALVWLGYALWSRRGVTFTATSEISG